MNLCFMSFMINGSSAPFSSRLARTHITIEEGMMEEKGGTKTFRATLYNYHIITRNEIEEPKWKKN